MKNSGRIVKGEHRSQSTEFTEGAKPWNKGKVYTAILGEKHPSWKGGKPNCKDCGIKLKKYTSVRCLSCYHASPETKEMRRNSGFKKNRFAGAAHPNWKGGITPKSRLERVKFRQTMQQLVFQKDDYTCQICEQQGGYLQVDHIKRWAEYPELRFEIDNCRTVCMACHYYITFKRKLPEGVIWGHNLSRRIES